MGKKKAIEKFFDKLCDKGSSLVIIVGCSSPLEKLFSQRFCIVLLFSLCRTDGAGHAVTLAKAGVAYGLDGSAGGAIVVVGSYERAVGIHSLSFSHWSDKLDSFAYCCALVLASAAVVGTESLTSVQGYQV